MAYRNLRPLALLTIPCERAADGVMRIVNNWACCGSSLSKRIQLQTILGEADQKLWTFPCNESALFDHCFAD